MPSFQQNFGIYESVIGSYLHLWPSKSLLNSNFINSDSHFNKPVCLEEKEKKKKNTTKTYFLRHSTH